MGLIKRLKRITSARVEAFLDTVEDPGVVLPQLITEMEEKVKVAANAEAKALTSVKSVQRKLDEAMGRVMRFGKGAELALKQGNEDMAREALAEQVKAEKDVEMQQKSLGHAASALEQAREARAQLEFQLEDLKTRKDDIITRARATKTQKKVQESVAQRGVGGRSVLEQVAEIESRVDEDEAEAEVRSELAGKESVPLDERLRDLKRNSEIEDRLARLRKKK